MRLLQRCRVIWLIYIFFFLAPGIVPWSVLSGNDESAKITPAATHEKPLTSSKGGKTVATIEMKVLPVKDAILSGQSLPITVQVKNIEANPVPVHDPEYGSPFVYELRSIENQDILYTVSEKRFRSILNPESQVADPPQLVKLSPGDVATYDIDLGEFFTDTVLPGRYDLVINYTLENQIYEAPAVSINISAPRINHIAATISRQTETLTTVFGHRSEDGRITLMQRDSRPGHPGLGVIHPRMALGADVPVTSLALALETGEIYGGRWLAWIQENHVGAAWGWGKSLMGAIGPAPTFLKQPRLIETGLRLDGPHALFMVSGYDKDERAVVKAYVFTYIPPPPP